MKDVKNYYTGYGIKEWQRLEKNRFNQLEFLTTMAYLKKYLPKGGKILDAGCGPGRYSIALAKAGYMVTLLDFTPKLLRIAVKQIKKAKVGKNIDAVIEGDIRDLSLFKNNSFDAVICTGAPISHLIKKSDRLKAVKEFKRVARKKAPIFISVIGRLGVISKAITFFPNELTMKYCRKYRDTGDYSGWHGFTAIHMFLLKDFEELVKSAGLKIVKEVGLEGLASPVETAFNKMCRIRKRWKPWLETHFKTCEMPAVVDTSQHILIVARK